MTSSTPPRSASASSAPRASRPPRSSARRATSPTPRVVAVAARDRDKAARFARKHGIAGVHGSYEALLADPTVDAVYNPLPNGLHGTLDARRARRRQARPVREAVHRQRRRSGRGRRRRRRAAAAWSWRRSTIATTRSPRACARSSTRARSAASATSRPGSAFRCRASPTSATTTRSPAARSWTPAATPCTWRASSAAKSPRSSRRPAKLHTPDVDRAMRAEVRYPSGHTGTHPLLDVVVDAAAHLRARRRRARRAAHPQPGHAAAVAQAHRRARTASARRARVEAADLRVPAARPSATRSCAACRR